MTLDAPPHIILRSAPRPARSRVPGRLAHHRHAAAVPLRLQGPRLSRARLSARRQARQRRRASRAQGSRGSPDRDRTAGIGAASGLARRLRGDALVDHRVHRAARIPVRQGDAARGAHHCAAGVPSPACPVPAFPSLAPDRRAHPRRGARHARHLDAHQLRAVLDPAHAGGDRVGVGDPVHAL